MIRRSRSHKERLQFLPGEQKKFIEKIQSRLHISVTEISQLVGVHERTLRDWKRERFTMPLSAVMLLSEVAELEFPKNIKIKDQFWYVHKAGQKGAAVTMQKYGKIPVDEHYRKQKWQQWWFASGKRKNPHIGRQKNVVIPDFSNNLAEFVGIMLGDGGMSDYQVTISCNQRDDAEYVKYIVRLVNTLFGVIPKIYIREKANTANVVISRVELVAFCNSIGLHTGNKLKQGLDIPEWVKKNQGYSEACVRGLMDTDGCIYQERHRGEKKEYAYPRVSFVSASNNLCESVQNILQNSGLKAVRRGVRKVQIEDRKSILDYFSRIGTNNPKHKKRFNTFFGGVEQLVAP